MERAFTPYLVVYFGTYPVQTDGDRNVPLQQLARILLQTTSVRGDADLAVAQLFLNKIDYRQNVFSDQWLAAKDIEYYWPWRVEVLDNPANLIEG
jgi:hypothetical protein